MDAFEIMCIVIMAIGAFVMFWNLCGLIAARFKQKAYWQQYRIQAAISAMQAHIGDGEHMASLSRNLKQDGNEIAKFVAKCSVMYADALVEELQKK